MAHPGAPLWVKDPAQWIPYLVVLTAVGVTLLSVGLLQGAMGSLGMAPLLYLVPTTLAAARWGRWPALVAVLASVVGHDVLFVEPVGALTIARADEAVGLALLLFTAVVTAQLADAARQGAAQAREAEVVRRSDQLKTALLRAVSHDLRTPLSSIKAGVSGLRQTGARYTEEDREELLAAIEEEADRLDRLVAKLLEASLLEAGAASPRKRSEDVGDLVHSVVRRLAPLLSGRRVDLSIGDDPVAVPCDYVQIDHVVTNLIENAARHTPAGTPISVLVTRGSDAVKVTVADGGPGIPQSERERLLRPFERGASSSRGVGLGLAIARGFVEAHGGRLWVEDAEAGGAQFSFTLPLIA
ncbi:MAG: PAS domain-containing sensor histidine kinase [Chloroflexi bacterium]|nr:PAS domain-containing sensor histidine kinase [Chloroflexota bacterium]